MTLLDVTAELVDQTRSVVLATQTESDAARDSEHGDNSGDNRINDLNGNP